MTTFVSTRASQQQANTPGIFFSEAVQRGLAGDGGLFVPQEFPKIDIESLRGADFLTVSSAIANAFIGDDPVLRGCGAELCRAAFDFAIPLKKTVSGPAILELFHGPTAAFKDVGARFLGACISLIAQKQAQLRTVLVATSGDTGGAVAAAFVGKPQTEVFVLYPAGRISARQEQQLTCWGRNVTAFAVAGVFDDCQRLVKSAFLNPTWQKHKNLISANSINIGRILPQSFYYAWASMQQPKGTPTSFVVPSGNLGNAVSGLWAQRLGFPVGHVVLACNANKSVPDFMATGQWRPQPTVATIANAMDVGDPSNMERLRALFGDFHALAATVSSVSVSDALIRAAVTDARERTGEVLCPHTAAGWHAAQDLKNSGPVVLVATAHPAKFDDIIEPLVGPVEVPSSLQQVLNLPSAHVPLAASLEALSQAVGVSL